MELTANIVSLGSGAPARGEALKSQCLLLDEYWIPVVDFILGTEDRTSLLISPLSREDMNFKIWKGRRHAYFVAASHFHNLVELRGPSSACAHKQVKSASCPWLIRLRDRAAREVTSA